MKRFGAKLKSVDYALGLERFGEYISKRIIWRCETNEKALAITFDDGPHPVQTVELLDILARENVTATFFLLGMHALQYPDVVRQIVMAGHEIGNHTHSHPTLMRLSNDEIVAEISRCQEAIGMHTGQPPQFFRPPKGLFNRRVLDAIESCNLQCVIGDVYPRDVHLSDANKIVDRVLDRTQPGSIVILHDGSIRPHTERRATIAAVGKIIPALKQRGFFIEGLTNLTTRSP